MRNSPLTAQNQRLFSKSLATQAGLLPHMLQDVYFLFFIVYYF